MISLLTFLALFFQFVCLFLWAIAAFLKEHEAVKRSLRATALHIPCVKANLLIGIDER